jgi:sulfur carrier protein
MQVTVNGQERDVSGETTVEDLVALLGAPDNGRGVAVALSGEVVPRSEWAQTSLKPGDRVEVLIAVQGG